MRDYGIVSPKLWTGSTGKSLRGDLPAQLLAVYLMTSPHSSMTGVFWCPLMYMAHETGLGIEGASKALARLIEEGFCEYEEASESVFVVQMARFQIAEQLKPADKRVDGLKKDLSKMPDGLRARFLAVYGAAYCLENDSPLEAPSKPQRSQEQEQEQEQNKEKTLSPSGSDVGSEDQDDGQVGDQVTRLIPVKAILAAYHEKLPMMPHVRVMTDPRKRKLKGRWLEDGERQTVDWWADYFAFVAQSDFLTGRSGQWTGCDFEWLIEASNLVKVTEGKYENRSVG